jgi:hypothetical protein
MAENNAERQARWRERRQERIKNLEAEVVLLQRAFQDAVRERDEARATAHHLFAAFEELWGMVHGWIAGLQAAREIGDLDEEAIESIEAHIEGLGDLIRTPLRNEAEAPSSN